MLRRPLALLIALVALMLLATPASAAVDASGTTGSVRFVKRMTPAYDRYVTNPSPAAVQWTNEKFWRMEVFTPFFDSRTAWYGNGWIYRDLYSIGTNDPLATQRPEWILKDAAGRKLYIPWGCSNGWCPQYAADITNPEYRAWWISSLVKDLAKGYRGAWIDDVNLEVRVSDQFERTVLPVSPLMGRTMSAVDWRRAVAEFTEQIRAAVPAQHEILHNSIWYAAQGAGRDADPFVQRQIAAADYINIERGFNDEGLTGGNGEWSLRALQGFIERVQGRGKGVIIDAFDATPAGMEYSLANYLLINTGRDGVGQIDMTPDNWWSGWDTDLGTALTGRYDWMGLQRRDFTGGMVLVGEPGAPARTVQLPAPMTTIDGQTVTSVTVGASRGAVLRGPGQAGTPQAPPAATTPATPGTTPGSGSKGNTTPASKRPASCKKVRVSYKTILWDAKKRRLIPAKGTSVVCLRADLGTRAHRSALKRAREQARRGSVRRAKAARRAHVKAARAKAARRAEAKGRATSSSRSTERRAR